MTVKTKNPPTITDIKPIKTEQNGPEHPLDEIDNQNTEVPVSSTSDNNQEVKSSNQEQPEVNFETEAGSIELKKTVAGNRIIEPLATTEEEKRQLQAGSVTQISDANEINYAMPDSSQKMASETQSKMQSPRFFDTKEYHLPISQTKHSHGFWVGSIIAGLIFAGVVAAIALFTITSINK